MSKRYELINPSDKIFFDAKDLATALIAVSLIGNLRYGAHELGTTNPVNIPTFLFGGWDNFINKNFDGRAPEVSDEGILESVADCLKTFRLASQERTSMNDICGNAHAYAQRLERLLKLERLLAKKTGG